MHLVKVSNLKSGETIGRSIYNARSKLQLAAGYKLTAQVIKKLNDSGFNYAYVMDGVADDLSPEETISDTLRQTVSLAVESSLNDIQNNRRFRDLTPEHLKRRLEEDKKLKSLVDLTSFRKYAGDMLEDVIYNDIHVFSSLPMRSSDGHEVQHAVDTALLTVLMGQELELPWDDIVSLATSSLLHDIGKMILAGSKQHRPMREHIIMLREHPTYSMLILKGSDSTSFREQLAVQHHHEQLDGKGFPLGLREDNLHPSRQITRKGRQIFRHAVILAVANQYDNLISGLIDGHLHTPEQAVAKIIHEASVVWNSFAARALSKVVQLFPVGSRVKFIRSEIQEHAGCQGVVVENYSDNPLKPKVVITHNSMGQKMEPEYIETASDERARLELIT